MAYASSEKVFYQRHYAGGLKVETAPSLTKTYESHYAPGKRYHLLLSELEAGKTYKRAVEIGCAGGDCLAFLADRFKFESVVGIDIAFPDGMNNVVDGVQFMQANSNERLPLADASVDVYVAMMVIEHLFDPFHAFKEIERVLTPDGRAVINLPLVTSIKNRMRLLFGKLPVTSVAFERWIEDHEWDGNHLHYFSVDSIKRLADECGLMVTRMAGVGSHHQLKSMAPSFLSNELSFVVQHKR